MSAPSAVAWWLETDAAGLADEPRLVGELDPEDRARLARRRTPEARRALLVTRALLRRAVGAWLGVAPEGVRLAGGGEGPLRVASPACAIHVGVTHTRGLVACAVGDAPVGVDAERRDRPLRALALARRFFAPEEAACLASLPERERREAFLRLWVAKEAALKAAGLGLAHGLARVRVAGSGPGTALHLDGRRLAVEVTAVEGGFVALALDGPEAILAIRRGPPTPAWPEAPLGAPGGPHGRGPVR